MLARGRRERRILPWDGEPRADLQVPPDQGLPRHENQQKHLHHVLGRSHARTKRTDQGVRTELVQSLTLLGMAC